MKVSHILETPNREIEVNVSIEDILAAFEEVPDDDRPRTILLFLNLIAGRLKAITDDMIASLTAKQREVVGTFIAEQADRYQVFMPSANMGTAPIEQSEIEMALACVESNGSNHWPTVAGILAHGYMETLKRIPVTADGKPIFIGDTLFADSEETEERIVQIKVECITGGKSFDEYKGEFTITGGDFESGNLDFYTDRKALEFVIWGDPEERPAPAFLAAVHKARGGPPPPPMMIGFA